MSEVRFDTWTTADLAGQCRMQARELLDPEHSAFMLAVSARLTALASAEARARREALEEAAEAAQKREGEFPIGAQAAAHRVVSDIRALAASTAAEPRQTETGWDAAVAAFCSELPDWTSYRIEVQSARAMTKFYVEIARLADTEDGEERIHGRGSTPLEAMQDALSKAPPAPALGSVGGEDA